MAGELDAQLATAEKELVDVEGRLGRLYDALETGHLTMEALSPRILSLRQRQDQLIAARDEASELLERRRTELPTTEEIKYYVADLRMFLQEGTVSERRSFIRSFVKGIELNGERAKLS